MGVDDLSDVNAWGYELENSCSGSGKIVLYKTAGTTLVLETL